VLGSNPIKKAAIEKVMTYDLIYVTVKQARQPVLSVDTDEHLFHHAPPQVHGLPKAKQVSEAIEVKLMKKGGQAHVRSLTDSLKP
jgi:hypothetical protein